MREEDRKIYDRALADYSLIIRSGGNSLQQIENCMHDLILKAYQSKNNNEDKNNKIGT